MEGKDKKNQAETRGTEPTELRGVLQALDPEQRDVIMKAFCAVERHSTFCGPLPAPADFKAYQEVVKDAPERILTMAENQSSHRIKTEEKIVDEGIRESKHGQIIGAILVVLILAATVFLAMFDHGGVAVALVAAMTAIGVIFVLHKEPNKSGARPDSDE